MNKEDTVRHLLPVEMGGKPMVHPFRESNSHIERAPSPPRSALWAVRFVLRAVLLLALWIITVPIRIVAAAIRGSRSIGYDKHDVENGDWIRVTVKGKSMYIAPEQFVEVDEWMDRRARLRSVRIGELHVPWWLEPRLRTAIRSARRAYLERILTTKFAPSHDDVLEQKVIEHDVILRQHAKAITDSEAKIYALGKKLGVT